MTKGFFLVAAFLAITAGGALLCVDEIELRSDRPHSAQSFLGSTTGVRRWEPPEYLPWTCMSGGAVGLLWTLALFGGKKEAKH